MTSLPSSPSISSSPSPPAGVVAESAEQFVLAGIAEHRVIAVEAEQDVVVGAAEQSVVALVAVERCRLRRRRTRCRCRRRRKDVIAAVAAMEDVVAGIAGHSFDPCAAAQDLVAGAADTKSCRCRLDEVVALAPEQAIVAIAAFDHIVAAAAVDEVIAAEAPDPIAPRCSLQCVVGERSVNPCHGSAPSWVIQRHQAFGLGECQAAAGARRWPRTPTRRRRGC